MHDSIAIPTVDNIRQAVREEVQTALESHRDKLKKEKQFLTRKETAELLSISLPTLHSYTKDGLITSHRIGGRVLYRLDDIEKAITTLEK